jgi:hypothetical protein
MINYPKKTELSMITFGKHIQQHFRPDKRGLITLPCELDGPNWQINDKPFMIDDKNVTRWHLQRLKEAGVKSHEPIDTTQPGKIIVASTLIEKVAKGKISGIHKLDPIKRDDARGAVKPKEGKKRIDPELCEIITSIKTAEPALPKTRSKRNGIIVTIPNDHTLWSKLKDIPEDFVTMTPKEARVDLTELTKAAGLSNGNRNLSPQ